MVLKRKRKREGRNNMVSVKRSDSVEMKGKGFHYMIVWNDGSRNFYKTKITALKVMRRDVAMNRKRRRKK